MMEKTRVTHPELGEGEIVQTRYGGFELLISFNDGIKRWIRFDDLKAQESSSASNLLKGTPIKTILSEQEFLARRMIEAFRLGIVPGDQVDQFTFGRDTEVALINKWLRDPDNNITYIAGEYGTGKSHLLSYTIGKAIRSGYAVALVETDRIAIPFYKPKVIYRYIIKAFHYCDPKDNEKKDFRGFLQAAIQHKAFEDHPYFKWFRTYDHEALWEWILCDTNWSRPIPYGINDWRLRDLVRRFELLPGFSTAANVYCYLLSSLGWAAKNLLGLSGLLVVFDEAESVASIGSQYYWEKADNFIQALIRTASNDKDLRGSPWNTGLTYAGHSYHIPFLYNDRSELKLMFAFTPSGYTPSNYRRYPYNWMDLENLTQSALKQIFHEICNLYKTGYANFATNHQPFGKIYTLVNDPNNNVRKFVKASVEALDIIRLTGNTRFLE